MTLHSFFFWELPLILEKDSNALSLWRFTLWYCFPSLGLGCQPILEISRLFGCLNYGWRRGLTQSLYPGCWFNFPHRVWPTKYYWRKFTGSNSRVLVTDLPSSMQNLILEFVSHRKDFKTVQTQRHKNSCNIGIWVDRTTPIDKLTQ